MQMIPRSRRRSFLGAVGLGIFLACAHGAHGELPPLDFEPGIELAPQLERDVRFWIDVFARYSRREAIVHDREEPAAILAVVPLRAGDPAELTRVRRQYQALLRRLGRSEHPQELAAVSLGAPFDPRWIGLDPERLRVQRGRREVFADSLQRSRAYLLDIRRAVRAARLPLALAYLPHVESSFNAAAVSPAGAVGLWQLMPETARDYQLRVDEEVDERQDAVRSMSVALAFLKEAHRVLQSWPLAITAYNYGVAGTVRGTAAVGSRDFVTFRAEHAGPSFGFASRNYYAQFLAAVQVAEHHGHYFRELRLGPLVEYVVRKGDTLHGIARRHGVPVEALRSANNLGQEARLRRGQRLIIEG